MLLAQNISLERSKIKIFNNINISLGSNSIVVLKGKNGSGKTSLIKTLLNILEPSHGSIFWRGKPINKNLYNFYKNVTYISDKTSSLRQLSVNENINIWKKLSLSKINNNQIQKVLSTLNIIKYENSRVSSLSLGERKKLELVRLIIENKKIWILDEPFTNLDFESIDVIEQTFEDHSHNGGTILFSTHQDLNIKISEKVVL
ncbi:heme ABC exporter ATP-binding protein CcmA [Pelagibacteraceae bacterium]|nr:heme ABC exporter ATP-binding protein CcmA [Pelagibacteraceae bacterium]